ncbi:hypothetical protein RB597_010414 [Gaeumannomyces tritici]
MTAPQEPIAIIGAGCRFPGASDRPSRLWDLLKEPRELAVRIPHDRFNVESFYHPIGARGGSTNVKEAYIINDRNIRHFDAQFFSSPPAEADAIDPQHRHLLEVVYEALEDAGLGMEALQGSNTALFVGQMCTDYSALSSRDLDHVPKYSAPGIAPSNASSRVSYFFDWHGPTITIDTACSSSLVALAQAVQTLRAGTSDVAVAAGTNLILDPMAFVSESNLGMLSPTGRSRMWDAAADGYARGDGVAAVILKTLSAAVRDGDVIDCVVREVGCNHDGRTQGITMPSGAAQASLIRDTYARAGLDPTKPDERCQYFEAHGTGTPAGDPQEASALDDAFFGTGGQRQPSDILYVGSIKTVIGHTEGTAGLAGVLKASLALKHGLIPPNLLLKELSPGVRPYCKHLRIPQELMPWPDLPPGVPRRASVNSFGFGGSNAHAILEAYEPPLSAATSPRGRELPVAGPRQAQRPATSLVPFVWSANSEASLEAALSSHARYIRDHPSLDLEALRFTLATKRSALPHKIVFPALDAGELLSRMEDCLEARRSGDADAPLGMRSTPRSPGGKGKHSILGVFTGQGAQWATMGARLVESSAPARELMGRLDESLQTLPAPSDRPSWTLLGELRKDEEGGSRVGEAALSQPLCTAVQLVLVDLLRAAGVRFAAVVGHSSGEIAAAYAAGFISARDAIRIAYYRGFHAKLAAGAERPDGSRAKGAMMAVGTTLEDARELCELDDLEGRLSVAACNSPSSVTLSGDLDALELAREALEDEKKFTRVLRVDTAYHSHHMKDPVVAFRKSLASCDIEVLQPLGEEAQPAWFSSVKEGVVMEASPDLKANYWAENMAQTVLFSQALQHAVHILTSKTEQSPFSLALEVGPHPALKGPAMDTLEAAGVASIMYTGTLERGKDDVKALSGCLGAVWACLGSAAVDWVGFICGYCGLEDGRALTALRGLPLYPWDHRREFWAEPRIGRLFRTQQDRVHELLGKKLPDGTPEDIRWKNVLVPRIYPWLAGHSLQGQTVYPAAGYIALAMEAAMQVASSRLVQGQHVLCIELVDLSIHRAIAFDENSGTELMVSLGDISVVGSDHDDAMIISANFVCRSPLDKESGRLGTNASGALTITIGNEADDDEASPLTSREGERSAGRLADVDIDAYYSGLAELGYGYSGPFRGLASLQRRLGFATGTISRELENQEDLEHHPLLFHPAMLDTSIHALFSSFGVPGDGTWSLMVPSKVRRVTLVPSLCGAALASTVEFDCSMSAMDRRGCIDIVAADGVRKAIEVDGLEFVPFSPFTEKDDRLFFSNVTWQLARPDGNRIGTHNPTEWDLKKVVDRERVAFWYLRTLQERTSALLQTALPDGHARYQETPAEGCAQDETVTPKNKPEVAWHHQAMFDFAAMCVEQVKRGSDPVVKPEWCSDTHDQVLGLMAPYGDDADFNIMRAVGEQMPAVVRGDKTILEVMMKDDMLPRFYSHGIGGEAANSAVALMLQQITNRFPHINMLEVGAGTGGATWEVMSRGTPFATYTYTDVSAGFFEKARDKFAAYADKMIFKVFDMEREPGPQGFKENSYDVVVASHCLHATASLERTMGNLRRLLKPGGFIVVLEVVQINTMPLGLIMGGLPGWWIGRDDGRVHGPNITLPQWNRLLRRTGFGGVDTFTPMTAPRLHTATIFAAQAVDEKISLMRRPFAARTEDIRFPHLVVLGGESMATAALVDELEEVLRPRCQTLVVASTLEELEAVPLPPLTAVLSVADLDSPVLGRGLGEARWQALQRLLGSASAMLWVTHGSRCEEPDSGTMLGLLQSIWYELEHLRSQLLEVVDLGDLTAGLLAQLMLQMQLDQQWKGGGVDGDSVLDPESTLYSIEPELLLDRGGVLRILRQKQDDEANARYNSHRRLITKPVHLGKGAKVEARIGQSAAVAGGLELELTELQTPPALGANLHVVSHCSSAPMVHVHMSTAWAVQSPAGLHFVALGREQSSTGNNRAVVALSHTNASAIAADPDASVPVDAPGALHHAAFLALVTARVLARHILASTAPGAVLLVHEPGPVLAAALEASCEPLGTRLLFSSTVGRHAKNRQGWIAVHPRMPHAALKRALPGRVDSFLDLSKSRAAKDAGARLSSVLPQACRRQHVADLVSHEATVAHTLQAGSSTRVGVLQDAVDFAQSQMALLPELGDATTSLRLFRDDGDSSPTLNLPRQLSAEPLALLNWSSRPGVPVAVKTEPIDVRTDIFQDGKTYWLLGLAGDLGQSLVDWMANHGARNIVISSRSVKSQVLPGWIAAHAARGVTVLLVEADVTNMCSLKCARDVIEASLPPIRGVANGALVLRDRLFINTDFDTFQAVLRPKALGTANLDAMFSAPGSLDWFIGFSSIVAVVGNYGQSAYSAGNNFVKALVNKRRRVGLPGATIDISTVRGVGYVEREQKAGVMTAKMVERIENSAMPMSERDLHQLFAEAVKAAPPDSGRHANITSGIQLVRSDRINKTFWANNLKFSHFVVEIGLGNQDALGSGSKVLVKSLLLEAGSVAEAVKIVRDAFTAKLNATIQNPATEKIPDSQPLIDLGIDSLVAVEVRTWFRQELGLDMPMLKILGGATMAELVEDAVARLPQELLPRVKKTGTNDPAALSPPPDEAEQTIALAKEKEHDAEDDKDKTGSSSDGNQTSEDTGDTSITSRSGTPVSEPAARPSAPALNPFQPEIIRTEPMNFGQARFWFLRKYLDDPTTANVAFYFRITSNFSPSGLSQALDWACERHEALRTCFFSNPVDATTCQGIMRKSAIRMEHRLVSNHTEARYTFETVKKHVYDLERGETLRLVLCEESPTSYYFILGYHHILMDGFSWEVLFSELHNYYRASTRQDYIPPPVTRQYADWSRKQLRDVLGGLELATDRKFWRETLSPLPPVLPLLPLSRAAGRKPLGTYELNRAETRIEQGLAQLVRNVAAAHKASPFHVHLTVFHALLFRLTGEPDVCIGMADAGRTEEEDVGIIGLLLNLLPLRFGVAYGIDGRVDEAKSKVGECSFADALRQTRAKVYAGMARARVPFNVILDDLAVPRSTSHHPLIQAFIEYRPARKIQFAGITGEIPPNNTSHARTPYDIELNVNENHAGDVTVSIGLQSSLYSASAAELVLGSYTTLLECFARSPESAIRDPDVYPRGDIELALRLGRGPSAAVQHSTVSQFVDAVASENPDKTALRHTDDSGKTRSLSYGEMLARVMDIHSSLADAGAKAGSRVAVAVQPSTDWVCCMLAVMRAGAVYIPLDCSLGTARLTQMGALVKADFALVDSVDVGAQVEGWLASAKGKVAAILDVHGISAAPAETGKVQFANLSAPDEAAAILFTSGTTGTPKGILLRHSSLANVVEATMAPRFYGPGGLGRQTVLQHSAPSFDMSFEQVFLALCGGGTLIIADRSLRGDSRALTRLIADEGVTFTKATPPEYSSWFRNGEALGPDTSLKHIFAGGDRMTQGMVDELKRRLPTAVSKGALRLFNSYGPAEGTVIVTKTEIPLDSLSDIGGPEAANQQAMIPIGFPLQNCAVYVVDDSLRLLPPGVSGEILIGGAGVAMGYLGSDDTPAGGNGGDKFITNPWADEDFVQRGWTKLYRTGDKGKLTREGTLLFEGRIEGDTQIKLRGVRIELEDIEHNIVQASRGAIAEAVCSLRGSAAAPETQFLVAHVVLSAPEPSPLEKAAREQTEGQEDEPQPTDLLVHVLASLEFPNHMKPARLIPLPRFPRTRHGKLDRAAIAALPLDSALDSASEASDNRALTETEEKVASIWVQMLSPEAAPALGMRPSTDFFALGGSSLMLVEVQAHIRASLGGVDVSLRDLYRAHTLSALASRIDELAHASSLDWEEECAPPRADELVLLPESSVVPGGPRTTADSGGAEVILTGATGHLGPYLLERLVSDPKVSKIHVVAVRSEDRLRSVISAMAPAATAAAADKVLSYPGDLAAPLLGLSTEAASQLAGRATAVLHAGAARLSWETFETLRAVNTLSTRELLRLAAPRRLPFHFISSGGVFPAEEAPAEVSSAPFAPAQLGADGYVASKWASERMLERAARDLGVDVRIYRTVRCDGADDPASPLDESLPEDIAAGMARATIESGTMLDHGGWAWSGWFDLVSVHQVVEAIVGRLLGAADAGAIQQAKDDGEDGGMVEFTHIKGTYRVWKVEQLHQLVLRPEIQANMGRLKPVPPQLWLGQLKRSGFPWMMGANQATYKDWVSNRR